MAISRWPIRQAASLLAFAACACPAWTQTKNLKPEMKQGSQPSARRVFWGDPLPDNAIMRLGSTRFRHPEEIDALLQEPVYPSQQEVKAIRAIEVLEHIGTKEAWKILEGLVRVPAGSKVTEEAKSSLERLAGKSR
jgi:hypothetical protein